MKFHTSYRIIIGLLFLLQFIDAVNSEPEDVALTMQRNVEHLIEKIIAHVEEYYQKIKGELRCLPDYIPDNLIETLKKSIDCVHINEKSYFSGKIHSKVHQKNFLKCFSDAKKEVQETMKTIDLTRDYCPENITEKIYQINVTTTFTKTFHINIKNGLEVIHKEIDFKKHFIDTFDQNQTVRNIINANTTTTDAYDLKDDRQNDSTEENYGFRQGFEPFVNEISEFSQEQKNGTTPENVVKSFSEKPQPRSDVQNETDALNERSHSVEEWEEKESTENGYYEIENEKELDPDLRDGEYVYEDDTHTDRNESESREYFVKIKPQNKNSDYFDTFEKQVTSSTF